MRRFNMREYEEDNQQINYNMDFQVQRANGKRGRGGFSQRRGNQNFSSRRRGFRRADQGNSQGTQAAQNQNQQKIKETTACHICGRNNHTTLKCFYKWDFSCHAAEDLPQALATMNLQIEKDRDENMYVDLGVTTQMTNSTCNLSKFKSYKGKDRIVVGNGSELGITHVGSTKISGLKINEMLVVP